MTNKTDHQEKHNPNALAAVRFLEQLRPGGPWVLTAIVPDVRATTDTFSNPADARAFIREHNGQDRRTSTISSTSAVVT